MKNRFEHKKSILFYLLPLGIFYYFLGLPPVAYAITVTWDNGALTNDWNNAVNWVGDVLPGTADDVIFDGVANNSQCNLNTNVTVNSVTFQNSFIGPLNFGSLTLTVTGNVNFAGGAVTSVTGISTGTLEFSGTGIQTLNVLAADTYPHILHSGSGTLQFITGPSCNGLTQNNGTLDFNLQTLYIANGANLTINNGTSTSLSGFTGAMTITVTGNATLNGQLSNLLNLNPAAAWNLTVTGLLSANYATIMNCNASAGAAGEATNSTDGASNTNWIFYKTWDGGGAGNNINDPNNWHDNTAVSPSNNLMFDGTSINPCVLNISTTAARIKFKPSYTGVFDFSTNILSITDIAKFQDASSINYLPGGKLQFSGTGPMFFYPTNGVPMPDIELSGSGTVTVNLNGLLGNNFSLSGAGTWDWGTGLAHSLASLTCSGGSINFNTSAVSVSGNVHLSGLSSLTSTSGSLNFNGAAAQTFTPHATLTHPQITMNGAGTVTVTTNGLIGGAFIQNSGTWQWGSLIHQLATINTGGGTMEFGTATVEVWGGVCNLSGLTNITGTPGLLKLTNTAGHSLTPRFSLIHPDILYAGTGTVNILTNALKTNQLTMNTGTGTFNLGPGPTHQIDNITASGGMLDVNTSTVLLSGNANFTSYSGSVSGAGIIEFTGTGTQILTFAIGISDFPQIIHSGAGTLQFAGYDPICKSFTNNAGTLDFNTFNPFVSNSGNFTINNGTISTIVGLAGRTITVNGSASLNGQNGNLLNLDPGANWTLNVTGSLNANYCRISHCNATGSTVLADNSFDVMLNSSNWTFIRRWDGGGVTNGWGDAANWTADDIPAALDSVIFDGLNPTKDCILNIGATLKHIVFTPAYLGTFDFNMSNLNVNGNADFRSGGDLLANDGYIYLQGTVNQNLIPPDTDTLPNFYFTGSATGTVTVKPLHCSIFYVSASTSATWDWGTGLIHEVASLSTAGNPTMNFNSSTVRVPGNVSLSGLSAIIPGSGTLEFTGAGTQSFTPMYSTLHPNINKTGSGTVTVITNSLKTGSFTMSSGNWSWGNLGFSYPHVIGSLTVSAGSMNMNLTALEINSGDADFSGLAGMTLTDPSYGIIKFNAMGNQTYTPPSVGLTMPDLEKSGCCYLLIVGNGVQGSGIAVKSGSSLDLGMGLTHYFRHLASLSGANTLNFSSSTTHASEDVDLRYFTVITTSGGILEFNGAITQGFYPKAGNWHPDIVMNGVDVDIYGAAALQALSFTQNTGSWNWGGPFFHYIGGPFTVNGGSMDLSSSYIRITDSPATLSGADSIVTYAGGLFEFIVNSGTQTLSSRAGLGLPPLLKTGAGILQVSTPIEVKGLVDASAGTWDWGSSANTNTIQSLSVTGQMEFGDNLVEVTQGNVNLGSAINIFAENGELRFSAISGTQVLTPHPSQMLPQISLTGSGTLKLNTYPLNTNSYYQSNGIIDFNGLNVTASNFYIYGGTSGSIMNLGGVTLNITGEFLLQGQETNLLNLDPAVNWYIVNPGLPEIELATVAKCSTAFAKATNSIDAGGNFNLVFYRKWDGGGLTNNWNDYDNWGGNSVPTYNEKVLFTPDYPKSCDLNVNGDAKAFIIDSGYTGNFDFKTNTLTVSWDVKFNGSGDIIPGGGRITFNGTGVTQDFYPPLNDTMPDLTSYGDNVVVNGNLIAGTLNLFSGIFDLNDSGYTHEFKSISSTGGTVTLDLGNAYIKVLGNTDFIGLGSLNAGSSTLEFLGNVTQNFTPRYGSVLNIVKKSGSGTVVLQMNILSVNTLDLFSGTWDWGTLGTNFVTNLNITGGNMILNDPVVLQISETNVNLSSLSSLSGNGELRFSMESGSHYFTPPPMNTTINITKNGYGEIIVNNNPLKAGRVLLQYGIWNWGNQGLVHTISSCSVLVSDVPTGEMNFGNSTVEITSGDLNLSNLETLTAGTGEIYFQGNSIQNLFPDSGQAHPRIFHTGMGTLRFMGNVITAHYYQCCGSTDFNGKNLTIVNGRLDVANGKSTSLMNLGGSTITVSQDVYLTSQPDSLFHLNPATPWSISANGFHVKAARIKNSTVTSLEDGNAINSIDEGGNVNWEFEREWDGGGATNNWSDANNWGGNLLPEPNETVNFDTISIKACNLDIDDTVTSLMMDSAYSGAFSFNSKALTLKEHFYVSGFPNINAGSGAIEFIGNLNHLIQCDDTLPQIIMAGTGACSVASALSADTVQLLSGYWHWNNEGKFHDINGLRASAGAMDFGNCNLFVTGNVDLSGLSGLNPGSAILNFSGPAKQTFIPSTGFMHPIIRMLGTDTVLVSSNALTTSRLEHISGYWHWGNEGLSHLINTIVSDTTFSATIFAGGTMLFGNSHVQVIDGDIDLSLLNNLDAGTGRLYMTVSTRTRTLSSKAGLILPDLWKDGIGTVIVGPASVTLGDLSIMNGSWDWGNNGLVHSVKSISSSAGGMVFGNSTVRVTVGNAYLQNLFATAFPPSLGTLEFTAATGTQTFNPVNGATHPNVIHSGSGILMLSLNDLYANSFTQNAGTLQMNGRNITVSGMFEINNGDASSIWGLAGRSITVSGNAIFSGTPAGPLNLNPGFVWYLTVAGSLTADYASLGFSDASGGNMGLATLNCINAGNNINWKFNDIIPPANNVTLSGTALNETQILLSWNPSAITEGDAQAIEIYYRLDAFPPDANDPAATILNSYDLTTNVDTVSGLLAETNYYFSLFIMDTAGNWSASASSAQSMVTTPDQSPPAMVSGLEGMIISPFAVDLKWTPSPSSDAESVAITYSLGGFPVGYAADLPAFYVSNLAAGYTLLGLQPLTTYYIALFVKDDAGNWSGTGNGAQISMTTLSDQDTIPPKNTSSLLSQIAGIDQYLLTWDISNLPGDVVTIGLFYSPNIPPVSITDPAIEFSQFYPVSVSSDTLQGFKKNIAYFFALALQDSGGNWSNIVLDTADIIPNHSPIFDNSARTDLFMEDQLSSFNLSDQFSDEDRDPLTFSANLPAWLNLSSAGQLSGTPANEDVISNAAYTLNVTDGEDVITVTFFYSVQNQNDAPVLTLATTLTAIENEPLIVPLELSDADEIYGDVLIVEIASGAESGMSLDAPNKQLSWTPTNEQAGRTYQVRFKVSDLQGAIDEKDLAITVENRNNEPSFIAVMTDATIEEDAAFSFQFSATDPDLIHGDQFTFNLLSGNSGGMIIDPKTGLLNWTPLNEEVGTHALTVEVKDQDNASVQHLVHLTVTNVNDHPLTVLNQVAIAYASCRINVSGSDEDAGDGVTRFICHVHDQSTGNRIDTKTSTSAGEFALGPLYDGTYRLLVFAVDQNEALSPKPVDTVIHISGANQMTLTQAGWQMIGIPALSAAVESYGIPLATSPEEANLFYWDPEKQIDNFYSHYLSQEQILTLNQGAAYWINVSEGKTFSLVNPEPYDTNYSSKNLSLKAGWNMVSNPLPYAVAVPEGLFFYAWNGSSYELADGKLDPWKGYWVEVPEDQILTLINLPVVETPATAKILAKVRKTNFINDHQWTLSISANTEKFGDFQNVLGFNPQAQDQRDNLDRSEPPRPFAKQSISLFFNNEKELSADIRKNLLSVNYWEMGLETRNRGQSVTLSLDPEELRNLPEKLYVYLFDRGQVQNLRENPDYLLQMDAERRYVTLIVTDQPDFLKTLALNYHLSQNFPNPFNPSTTIAFAIPLRWLPNGMLDQTPVKTLLKIYNMSGQEVKTLIDQPMIPGFHQANWEGRSNQGKEIATGVYFYRIQSEKFTATKKMIMVK